MPDFLINRMLNYPHAVRRRLRRMWFSMIGVKIRGRVWIQRIDIPRNPWDIVLDTCALDDGIVLLSSGDRQTEPRIIIRSSYINRYTMIDASEQIEIGPNVLIGPHCYITDHDHGMAVGQKMGDQALVGSPVRIERDVWLGAHVVVLKGVTIGQGAVVGAGAVVTKDIPAGTKVAGVPARVIGVRA